MLTQENITKLTKRAEQTASVDLGLWAALGMKHTDTYWFIKVFSKQTIKYINLQTTFKTLNKTFYENIFAYLENYETVDKQPVTLKLPIKTDIETGEIHNLQLISHFLQNAKGLWEIEFFEGLYKEQISEKTKTDWKNFLNIDCIQPTISLQLLKISLLPIPYIKDIASSLQIIKLKNLEIFAQKIDEEKLHQLGLILSKIQVPSLHVSLEPEKNLETSVGKFLSTICQNSDIKELKLQSNSAIILNAFPDISANYLKTLDLSGNMMANLHFLNIALQKNNTLSRIKTLILENCNLTTNDVKTILTNTPISTVNLSNNRLTENIFDILRDNVALDSLNLRGNPFIDPNVFIEKLLNYINSNKTLSTLSLDPFMPLSRWNELSHITHLWETKEDWVSKILLKFHTLSYETSAQQHMEQRNKILSAYKKNPTLKIILPKPNPWLNKIDQEKEQLNRPEKTWLAKQVFFKLSHGKDQPAGIGVENIIANMANLPIHDPKSFLNALRCHKNSLPKPSIVNTITDLWRASKDEYAMVCQIENNLCEDRHDECITLATNAANNTNYSLAFRRLCREITGTLKDLAADEALRNFKIV